MPTRDDSLALDHLFVLVERGAPERVALESAGLRESFRRSHPGQGTANVCFCFDNAYLELLWVEARDELASPLVARTRLAARAAWRRTGASPFGVAVRSAPPGAPLPFATWDYRPPYVPEGVAIDVALASADLRQPFLFRPPGARRPDAWADGRAGARQRPAGFADIAGVHLDLSPGAQADPALRCLQEAGVLSLGEGGAGPRMVVTFSRVDGGPARRLSLPDFTWAGG
ncbi:VOC family protein [Sorangium sp. So ce1036]|uniref:VOC family protein n=1 Tax=Sorangium sp. So ce1036 TaxID=3133328 RepID=UPI003F0AAE1E